MWPSQLRKVVLLLGLCTDEEPELKQPHPQVTDRSGNHQNLNPQMPTRLQRKRRQPTNQEAIFTQGVCDKGLLSKNW